MASSDIDLSSVAQRLFQTKSTQPANLESDVAGVSVAASSQPTTIQNVDEEVSAFKLSKFSLETFGLRMPNNIGDLAAEAGLSELVAEFLERDNKGLKGVAQGVAARDELSQRLENLEKIGELEEQAAELGETVTTLEGEISTLTAQEAGKQAELDEKTPELDALRQDEADLEALIAGLSSDPANAEELAAAQTQLTQVRADIAAAEDRIATLQNDLGEIRSDLAAAQQSLSDTRQLLAETQESLSDARDLEIVLVSALQTLSGGARLKIEEDQDLATELAEQEFKSPFIVDLQRIYQRSVEDEFVRLVIAENGLESRKEELLATFLGFSGIVTQIRDVLSKEYAATAELDVDPFAQATKKGSRMQLPLG